MWPHLLEKPGILQEFVCQDDMIELSSMCTACARKVDSPGDPFIGGQTFDLPYVVKRDVT